MCRLFQLLVRFACIGNLIASPDDSVEVIVCVSESGSHFPRTFHKLQTNIFLRKWLNKTIFQKYREVFMQTFQNIAHLLGQRQILLKDGGKGVVYKFISRTGTK